MTVDALVRSEDNGDGVVVLTLADPDHRNALRLEMTRAIAAAVAAALDAGARAIVLAAEPPAFCAGGSIDDLLQPRASLSEMYAGFLALSSCPVPTIAAVGGACVGAGVNLPLACDVVVASPAARFDPRWLDVGIHPGGAHLRRLTERVGRQATAAMVLCGESLDGEAAVAAGLAWTCVAPEVLLETAVALARRAASRDPELVRRTKASLAATLEAPTEAEALVIETAAQQWSMDRPGFRDGIAAIQARMQARKA
ncbi:MAG: Enoyl-CoA hydratase/isomerase [Ilumatobacteraceae bacterium]|nr:Enoyl-CoA hydratase/isomerase [Ilumatobacteraceae bacterium]